MIDIILWRLFEQRFESFEVDDLVTTIFLFPTG